MNHPKLLEAQYNLILTVLDPRAKPAVENYVAALRETAERRLGLLRELLDATGMMYDGEPEIPEEISARLDINLDLARALAAELEGR